MRKILIIVCGLMVSGLSAMNLPDHIQVFNYEKITIQKPMELFADQVLYVENYVVSDFVIQLQNTVKLQTFAYVHYMNDIDRKGFVKPILYENFTQFAPLNYCYTYEAKVSIWNEVLFSNRIRDMSKTLVV